MRISSVKIVSICIGNPALDPIQEDCRHFQRVRVAVGLAAAEPRGRLATSSHAPAMSSIVQSIFGSGQRTMEASQVNATARLHIWTSVAVLFKDAHLTELK